MILNYDDLFKRCIPEPVPFLCNGKKECNTKPGCFKNGGECTHTFDPKYKKINSQKKQGLL